MLRRPGEEFALTATTDRPGEDRIARASSTYNGTKKKVALAAQIAARLKEWQPDALVVGVPFHPDGAAHENTERARKFAR